MNLDRQFIFRLFFFAVFLYLLYQFMLILSPFFGALLGAITLALIFYPMHNWILKKFGQNASLTAGVSTAAIVLMVVVPVLLLTWLLIREASDVYPAAQQWVKEASHYQGSSIGETLPRPLDTVWIKAEAFVTNWDIDPKEFILSGLNQLGKKMSAFGTKMVKNILFSLIDILVLVFALFFFFRDGPRMVRWIAGLLPMEKIYKDLIIQRLDTTLSAVVRGVFITASVQGLLAGIGFFIVGLRFSVLMGFATAFMAMIPFVGAAAVWVPVAIFLFIKGAVGKAIFIALWGILAVSMIDNFLKPILIGEKARLPVFLLFFGILGGLQVYGFMGILIGPLMIACVLSFAKIYKEQFDKRVLSESDSADQNFFS